MTAGARGWSHCFSGKKLIAAQINFAVPSRVIIKFEFREHLRQLENGESRQLQIVQFVLSGRAFRDQVLRDLAHVFDIGNMHLGARAVSALRDAGISHVDDLVKEAMLNPDLARALLQKVPAPSDKGAIERIVRAAKQVAIAGPTIGSTQADRQ